jgi:glycosyltransferase involved in cell wall biosynthesis
MTSPGTKLRGGVVVLLSSITMRRGGVTRAVLNRVRLYADHGIPVRIVITAFRFDEDREAADIRKAWGFPESVEFRYFWREAAPGGGGVSVDDAGRDDELGLTSFRDEKGDSVWFYDDGVLVMTKSFDDGHLRTITRFDAARRPVSRDLYDPSGRLVSTDQIDPGTGAPALRRWFDASGACWLTSWFSPSGALTTTVQHRPEPARYENHQNRVAEWLDGVLADWDRPVVMADLRRHDRLLLGLRHPNLKSVAVMHNCHTEPPHRSSDPTRGSFRRLLGNLDQVDAAVVLTHRQRDDIVERTGATNLEIINHPIPRVESVDVPRQPGLLVVVARLDGQKQLDHAIRAFALAAERLPDARFHIYGTGREDKRLRALVRELGMADRILLKGFTSAPQQAFAGATATVLSSKYEGLPLVLAEAMSVGTPFVAYDVNYGPAEVIRHGEDGLLVRPGDIEALADGMLRLLGDPAYAAKLGERAREVVGRFSRRRWADEWLGLHRRLIESTGVRAGA